MWKNNRFEALLHCANGNSRSREVQETLTGCPYPVAQDNEIGAKPGIATCLGGGKQIPLGTYVCT